MEHATLPPPATTSGRAAFYGKLVEALDLVCDCRYVWSAELVGHGLAICNACGRYMPPTGA